MATSKDTPTVADTLDQGDEGAAGPQEFSLYVLYSPDPPSRGRVTQLPRQTTRLGRNPPEPGDIELADPVVSKLHAEITWSPVRERYLLGDLRSSNGTYINGKRMGRELLSEGDILRVGDTVMRFVALDRAAAGWSAPADGLLVGRSPRLRATLERAERAATSDVTVLIHGETGCGKELVAQTLHAQSGRPGPLRAVNCAAIPRDLVESELFGHVKGAFSGADTARAGMFKAAEGGTLFLDEIGELAKEVQAKLLRALESHKVRPVGGTAEVPVDVRVVAATNRDLAADVESGEFRADLYARLAEWEIAMSPLRERPEDLWPLWEHFMARHAGEREYEMRGVVFEALALHAWPYNVRELLRVVRALTLEKPDGGRLELSDLPGVMRHRPTGPDSQTRGAVEPATRPPPGETPTPKELRQLVEDFKGNIKEVASFLGKDRTQVYRWLKRYEIDPTSFR
jgi:DNA-binding NtrC family response regulator